MTHRQSTTRAFTGDRGPPSSEGAVAILVQDNISPRMSRLPNGTLLCRDVPIARTGWMIYGPGETPVPVGDRGVALVERTHDDLFDARTIGSFMTVAVTDGHPPGDVVPANWTHLAKGFVLNTVRRGEGDDADVLLADLIITDQRLIDDVLGGKREVSCGYEADYEVTGPGVGRQRNIIGNHLALVEKGRCGPRCAIGDQALPLTEEGTDMTKRVPIKTTRRAVVDSDALETARQKANDAQAELEALEAGTVEDEDDDADTHIHIHTAGDAPDLESGKTNDRIAAIDKKVDALAETVTAFIKGAPTKTADGKAPPCSCDGDCKCSDELKAKRKAEAEEGEGKGKTAKTGDGAVEEGDSKALAEGFNKVLAQAEVLVPGFRMPTFDAAAKRSVTVDSMCRARRLCLQAAYATADGKTLIDTVAGDTPDLEKMDCAQAALLFNASSAAKAAMNNRQATGDGTAAAQQAQQTTTAQSIADINAANRKFWEQQAPATA